MTLPVNEIFETIQGEAHWTGTPSIFIRLQGCAVGCPWCDTKHTWAIDQSKIISMHEMVEKIDDADTYAQCSVGELVQLCTQLPSRHVVITGGEPCQHDIFGLTNELVIQGKSVQIETSGTELVNVVSGSWVTLSPKINMPGGKSLHSSAMVRANEIKMPVGKMADIDHLKQFLHDNAPFLFSGPTARWPTIWLQPLSQSEKATELCLTAAAQNGWRVSVQTHKYLGVR